jgi:DNA-binding SARP family transcriptional activator
MEFRVLGPLEVEVGGRLLPLRGRRQRGLLVLLVLNANEVVPDDRLLEDLWGDEPPSSGRAALRVRVSQLRKALGEGGSALMTRPPGYVLHVEPDRIDSRLFERLVGVGRTQLAEGAAELASMTLREALGLWRGPPLADVAYESFAQGEISRLEELRLAALEERVEADLALGRHAELVGELEALVAAEPLRERLRGQLMLALYRSGRQADALAAYREARQSLVEELGIEPSRALSDLEAAILRQDRDLEPPQTAPVERQESQPRAVEERKLVTVIAVDLAGPAPLADDPERAGQLLERYHEALEAEIDEAGGRLEAVAGDALTVVFGAPVAQEDHVERALHAALSMRHRLEELFGETLAPRVGVESGEIVVGRAPSGGSSLAGGALTTAARLGQAAEPGEILVGERAAAAAARAFEFGPAVDTPDGELRCRPLVRELALIRTQGAGGLRSAFVGREGELDALRSLYARTAELGRPQLVTVTGDAGVGKSRLTRELWDWLSTQSPEPLRRTGRCLPYGRGTTYRPLADVLREHFGLRESDTVETVRRHLAGHEILALSLGLDAAPELHPLTARDELQSAWVELLGELAAERPIVVLVEDLHLAQDPLLDLLQRLLDDVDGALLLIGTARPELAAKHPAWGRRRDAATIWLEPLSPEESERLLDELLEDDAPADLRSAALARAEGNPFFLEELLAGVHDHSLPLGTDVPDSVQAALAARIDLLPPIDKAALQAASVIGRVFWRGPVRALLEGESPDFAVLEARDFIRRRSGSSLAGEREFAFKHALTRDVAYAGLPIARRARLHAGFADWLERATEGRDEQAAFLAHHYAEAVRPEDADLVWSGREDELERLRGRAVVWLRRAAELAVARYELDDGIALLERALELAETDETRSKLWGAIGRANALKFDGPAFIAAMQNAIGLTYDDLRRGDLASELAVETFMRSGMFVNLPALERMDVWISTALALSGPDSRARARALVAKAFSDLENGLEPAGEAFAIAERLGDPSLLAEALDARHAIALDQGRYEEAREWGRQRLILLDSIPDPDLRADIVQTPIRSAVATCHFDEARELARQTDEITRPLTPHHRVHGVSIVVEVEELLGGWEAIVPFEERVRETAAANASTPCTRNARSLLLVGLAYSYLGEEEEARRLELEAEALGMRNRHVVDSVRLRLALHRGEREVADELAARLLVDDGWYSRGHGTSLATLTTLVDALALLGKRALVEEQAAPLLGRSRYLDPFVLRGLGIVRKDETVLADALARFEALGLGWHAEQTRALL